MTDAPRAAAPAKRILAALADPQRPDLARIAVAVAHPDDETIGCGAQLPRFVEGIVIHTTDGAPRRGFPTAYGSWQEYRDTRRGELVAAMGMASVAEQRLRSLAWPDQESMLHLAETSRILADRLSGCDAVITHAYEGGHPDHDSTAFAVHAACDLLRRHGAVAPAIIEVPLYRAAPDGGWMVQSFAPAEGSQAIAVTLSPSEQDLKHRMLAAYQSQSEILRLFGTDTEWFRVAPAYDFTRPPNDGAVLYEGFGWGMTGSQWLQFARSATRELALERAA